MPHIVTFLQYMGHEEESRTVSSSKAHRLVGDRKGRLEPVGHEELAQKHRQAGAELWAIREKYLSLLVDMRTGVVDMLVVMGARDKLMSELHSVYLGAPSTNYAAYAEAQ